MAAIVVPIVVGLLLVGVAAWWCMRRRRWKHQGATAHNRTGASDVKDLEMGSMWQLNGEAHSIRGRDAPGTAAEVRLPTLVESNEPLLLLMLHARALYTHSGPQVGVVILSCTVGYRTDGDAGCYRAAAAPLVYADPSRQCQHISIIRAWHV